MSNDTIHNPLISVICPFYNSSLYISEAIESILKQTYTTFELLLVNDNSTDNSLEIASRYNDSRILILNNTHAKGVAGATNTALDKAQGTYIALMDSDDISEPTRFHVQINYLETHNDISVVGTWMEEFGNGNNTWKFPVDSDEAKIACLLHPPVANPTAMFRKSLLSNLGSYYNEKNPVNQDYEFWLSLFPFASFTNIPEILHKYRVRETSVSNTKDAYAFDNWKRALTKLLKSRNVIIPDDFFEYLYNMKYPSFSKTYRANRVKVDEIISFIVESNKSSRLFEQSKLVSFFNDKTTKWISDTK